MFGKRRDAASYDADAAALFARWGTDPGSTRKQLYSDCIAGLKTDSVWSLLDEVQMYAAHSEADGLLGWKNVRNATAVNTPTFTTDRGIAGDAAASYIDTNIVLSTDGVNYAQDSACAFCYINAGTDTASSSGIALGSDSRLRLVPRRADDTVGGYINDATLRGVGSVVTRRGLTAFNRSGSTANQVYRNGSSLGSPSGTTSLGLPTVSVFVGGRNSGGSPANLQDNRFALVGFGASLDSTKQTALYNRFLTLLTAIGAN